MKAAHKKSWSVSFDRVNLNFAVRLNNILYIKTIISSLLLRQQILNVKLATKKLLASIISVLTCYICLLSSPCK